MKGHVLSKRVIFVNQGFSCWQKLSEKARKHADAQRVYAGNLHRNNVGAMEDKFRTLSGVSTTIAAQVDTEYGKKLELNKYILKRLTHLLYILGRQAIAVRGKDDSNSNFIVFLQMESEFNGKLQQHLQATKNTKKSYLSHLSGQF